VQSMRVGPLEIGFQEQVSNHLVSKNSNVSLGWHGAKCVRGVDLNHRPLGYENNVSC
jgi:hypothetical protein